MIKKSKDNQKKNEFIAKYGEENVSRIKYEQFLD